MVGLVLPVQERVPGREVQRERGCVLQRVRSQARMRGDDEPELRDRHRERVDVDPVHRRQGGVDAGLEVQVGCVGVPAVQQTVERSEQEVAGPAGRVDDGEPVERPLRQGRFEGLVEDELLDEDGGLQEGVRVSGVRGQVLVEVTEEPGRQLRVAQVADQVALVVGGAPEVDDAGGHRTRRRQQMRVPSAPRRAGPWRGRPRGSGRSR